MEIQMNGKTANSKTKNKQLNNYKANLKHSIVNFLIFLIGYTIYTFTKFLNYKQPKKINGLK